MHRKEDMPTEGMCSRAGPRDANRGTAPGLSAGSPGSFKGTAPTGHEKMLQNMMGASAGSKHVRGPKLSPTWAPIGGRGRTHADGAERVSTVSRQCVRPPLLFWGEGCG